MLDTDTTRRTSNGTRRNSLIAKINDWVEAPPKHSQVLTIDPETASLILSAYNKRNRPMKKAKIASMENDIKEGEWLLTGDTIKFSDIGILVDGQNRLQACVNAEAPITTHVVFGVDQTAFDRMDTGAGRTPQDMLSLTGVPNAAIVAHTMGWMEKFKSGRGGRHPNGGARITPHRAITLYHRSYKDVQRYIKTGRELQSAAGFPPSRGVVVHYALSKLSDKLMADEFMSAWINQHNLDGVPQAEALRKRLAQISAHTSSQIPARLFYATVFKAWNAYVRGKNVRPGDLQWSKEQAFPQIEKPK